MNARTAQALEEQERDCRGGCSAFAPRPEPARETPTIVVGSGKGGVGKSVVSVLIATAVAAPSPASLGTTDPMANPSTATQRIARVRPDATDFLHNLTAGVWYRVRDRNPEDLRPEPLEGYPWIEVHGRLQHVWAKHVEVREEPG